MRAFFYGLGLQWKLDIRSKAMLITCYVLPLLFFVFIGGIFTSVNPESRLTLIQSMSIFGISMGALVGLPPSLMEIYNSDIKKVYKANGIPLLSNLFIHVLSAFIHLLIMCVIIFFTAPLLYDASIPDHVGMYILTIAILIAATLGIGCVLGLAVKNMAKLTMVSQVVFMPSLMLSGIMFPTSMLPDPLKQVGKLFPATWAFEITTTDSVKFLSCLPMIIIFVGSVIICGLLLKRKVSR